MNSQDESQIALLRNLYAKQAHLIDTGQHEGWAHTFTADGEFHSPTCGEPAIGHDRLADISRRFSETASQDGESHPHVIENVWVTRCEIGRASGRERVCQYVYLSVVAVPLKNKTHINTNNKQI